MIINFNMAGISTFTIISLLDIAYDIYNTLQIVQYFDRPEEEASDIIVNAAQFVKAAMEVEAKADSTIPDKEKFSVLRNYKDVCFVDFIIETYNGIADERGLEHIENPITTEDIDRDYERAGISITNEVIEEDDIEI